MGGLQYIPKGGGVASKGHQEPRQKEALLKLLTELKTLYPAAQIHGHRDFEGFNFDAQGTQRVEGRRRVTKREHVLVIIH